MRRFQFRQKAVADEPPTGKQLLLCEAVADFAGIGADEGPALHALRAGGGAFLIAIRLSDGFLLAVHDGKAAGLRRDGRRERQGDREGEQSRSGHHSHCLSPCVPPGPRGAL
jgi:hypothetical protein